MSAALDISPTVSVKPTRGRPPRFHPDHVAFMMGAARLTTRGSQNKIYMGRAHRVLEPVLAQYPELGWLLNRADDTYRVTIVSELGRVRGEAALIFLAREVGRHRLKSREAVAYLRRARRRLEHRPVPAASASALADALRATVDDYRRRYPDMTASHLRDALELVYVACVPEDVA